MPGKDKIDQIFKINNESAFQQVALELFHYQAKTNPVYRNYISALGINTSHIKELKQIPFLPVEFFKTHKVVCGADNDYEMRFTSSGTTGSVQSSHYVKSISVYEQSFLKGFELFYGDIKDYCILALLPSYLERQGSSLVYMFDKLISLSNHPLSGFYLNEYDKLIATLETLKQSKQKTLLLGVTYALLDLAETGIKLADNIIVMETGGMKGKRREMIKEELYAILKTNLGVTDIHSEYGMTELLSQAYSTSGGKFICPPWMSVLIREVNDPFSYVANGKSGGVNVIDLSNVYSCSFIETRDMGKRNPDNSFEITGRFDNSDLRGCNLMIQ